jgi:hypothetical protein
MCDAASAALAATAGLVPFWLPETITENTETGTFGLQQQKLL